MESRPKTIAVFVTSALDHHYRDAVSGHLQFALSAVSVLHRAGHKITLITTGSDPTAALPVEIPDAVEIRTVARVRKFERQNSVDFVRAFVQGAEVLTLLRKERFEFIHVFGGFGSALLFCVIKMLGVTSKVLLTPLRYPYWSAPGLRKLLLTALFKRFDHILATSEFLHSAWASLVGELKCRTLRTGVLKSFPEPSPDHHRNTVLFWRNADHDNGIDLAVAAFAKLALEHREIRFCFAVRPHSPYDSHLRLLSRQVDNIEYFVFPYADGKSIQAWLRNSLFAVFPFRRLSINPQLSILETLYAGVPVIATEIESNNELVLHEVNGLLIPPGNEMALICAIERLLTDRPLLIDMQMKARSTTAATWNWNAFEHNLLWAYRD